MIKINVLAINAVNSDDDGDRLHVCLFVLSFSFSRCGMHRYNCFYSWGRYYLLIFFGSKAFLPYQSFGAGFVSEAKGQKGVEILLHVDVFSFKPLGP